MAFQISIPDPHMGFYSKSILGYQGMIRADGTISPGELSVDTFTVALGNNYNTWVYDTWFLGYYAKDSSYSGWPSEGWLTNTDVYMNFDFNLNSNTIISLDDGSEYQGLCFVYPVGYMYLFPNVIFNDLEKGLWTYDYGTQSWLFFNRYWSIKNYKQGDGLNDFNTFDANFWMKKVLDLNTNDMTAGEGIVSVELFFHASDIPSGMEYVEQSGIYWSNVIIKPYLYLPQGSSVKNFGYRIYREDTNSSTGYSYETMHIDTTITF